MASEFDCMRSIMLICVTVLQGSMVDKIDNIYLHNIQHRGCFASSGSDFPQKRSTFADKANHII